MKLAERADIVLRLRDVRRRAGLTQQQLGKLSGVGHRTISSFESGERIHAIKLRHLLKILEVVGVTIGDFFSPDFHERFPPIRRSNEVQL